MSIWWDGLSSFQQSMFVVAIIATILMIVMLVLMLIGIDDGFEGDASFDDIDSINDGPLSGIGALRIFTFRGVLAFLSVGGWVAYIAADELNPLVASLIGIVSGSIAAFLLALALRAAMKLESQGNINYNNTIGKNGTVYIRVPKNRTGKGKVTVTAQERFLEIDAITEDDEDLKTGTNVQIVGLENPTTIIVKRK